MGKPLSEVIGTSAQSGKALDENLKKIQISHEKNLISVFTAPTGKRAAENAKTKMQSAKTAMLDKLTTDLKKHREDLKNYAKGVWADVAAELAPQLSARTYYGMPAYANKDGKVVLFFQSKDKFKTRYSTLGFNDLTQLDDGDM